MKPTRYISLIIALLSVLGIAAQQQQSQYALYNYRNDGDFNAWLNIDIDSITYSNIGIDSVEYDNLVTQEVWTPDSCYRIPLEAIDSIGFRTPRPEYQDDVFHITIEHLPYITAVDSLTITFYSTLPVMMRPVVGQVVTSDTFEEPLTEGFAGKVLEINDDGEHVTIICEGANVTDVFKRLVLVGKAVGVNEEEAKSRPLRKPRKIWGDYEDSGDVEFEFPGKVSVKINDFLSIEDEVSMAADYYVYVDLPRFKMRATATGTHNLKTSWSIDSDKILEWMGLERDKFEPDWATPFWPVVAIPGVFSFGVKLGGFLDPSVKLSLTGSTPITFTHTFGVEFSNTDTHVMFPMVIPIANVHSELGTPEISLSLEGKLFAGIALGLKTKLIADNVVHGDITGRFGPEFDAKIQMKQTLGEGDPISWYSLLKDSKVGVQIKADAKVKAKVFGKNMTENLAWDWKWPIPGWELTRYLFPDFTKPELPHYLMPEPLDMTTTPHKDIIMPIYAGLGIYDEEGTQQRAYYSGELYRTDAYYKRIPHIYIGDLPAGQKFTCRPIFNIPSLPGIGEIKADPVTEFTVPDAMTLDKDAITLQKGKTAYVAINDGWGDFSAHTSMRMICDAEIATIGNRHFVKIVAKTQMAGSATVTVKDLRSGETAAIRVTVTSNDVPEELVLSEEFVTLQESESKIVFIITGNGSYTAKSSNEKVATATIDKDKIFIAAVGEGSALITVTDTETEKTVDIDVTVTPGTPPEPDDHEWVDLGLPSGTLWATCNVGANSPEEYGDYFAWGETEPKSTYAWSTYKYCNGSYNTLTKYCTQSDFGTVDNKTELEPADDAATINWGSDWQMPSKEQMDELTNSSYTTAIWTTQNGVNGLLITSKSTGSSIFMPASGYRNTGSVLLGSRGYYWTRSLIEENSYEAYDIRFYSKIDRSDDLSRYFGQSVRPVRKKN